MLRNAMCALAAMMAVPRAPVSVMRHYYEESRRLLLDNLDELSIETWQTTLVLSMFSMFTGRIGPAFRLIGMAARLTSLFQVDQAYKSDSVYASMTELEQEIFIAILSGLPVQLLSFNDNVEEIPRMPDEQWFSPSATSAVPPQVVVPESSAPAPADGTAEPRLGRTAAVGGIAAAGGMAQSKVPPHTIFASRIVGIFYDISKAYDDNIAKAPDAKEDPMLTGTHARDQNPRTVKWRREFIFEKRLEDWGEQLPPKLKMNRLLKADEPSHVAKLLMEDLMDDEPPEKKETGAGSMTVIRMILFITSRCCLLQLHRGRLHARRLFSMEERQACTWPYGETATDSLNSFDPPTSRGLSQSLKVGCDVSMNILSVFKAVANMSSPARPQPAPSPRVAQIRRGLSEFHPRRGTPISGLGTTLASICLVECCVAVGWVMVLGAVQTWPGRRFCGRDWERWRGLWVGSEWLRDSVERARLLQTAVKGLSIALCLMEDLTLVRREKSVSPNASEGGTASSHNGSCFHAASSGSRSSGPPPGVDRPARSFRVDGRWADAIKEIVIRYGSEDLCGWGLRTEKEVETEIEFLERMEAMLEEQKVMGRIPFDGIMEAL
ncbi:hypothetical protein HDU96_005197 [Phlyctochytrium bullatum]|nr:hypothetical protein HDU96_005197 [Phlyctochytrium bullatum]